MATLTIEITTPERTVVKEEADSITVPTQSGEITVLPGHAPLVTLVRPGGIVLRKGRTETVLAVSTGILRVEEGSRLLLLADTAERADELDERAIEEARARAERVMSEHDRKEDQSFAEAAAALDRELARLKVVRRHRSRGIPGGHAETGG